MSFMRIIDPLSRLRAFKFASRVCTPIRTCALPCTKIHAIMTQSDFEKGSNEKGIFL